MGKINGGKRILSSSLYYTGQGVLFFSLTTSLKQNQGGEPTDRDTFELEPLGYDPKDSKLLVHPARPVLSVLL